MVSKVFTNYKLHLIVIVIVIISELIGSLTIDLGQVTIVFSPLIWAMLISTTLYLFKPLKLLTEKATKHSNFMMGVTLALLIAKLGVTSGAQLNEIRAAGLALVLQNFGNIGTIFLALPICYFFKLKRESVGMSHALSREANVGLIQDLYGAESPEFRGVMAVYIVGTLFGPIIMSLLASFGTILGISPLAAAMGVGAGSASMMTAGLAALIESFPDLAEQMTAYAALSNLISSVIALPLGAFIGVPLTEFLYKKFFPSRPITN